ncbi:SRPBCC family protein [Solimonas soli]|uniref:SRPBCC family protein n=1 Tax=Solimonas soli TaxID=413479 RepID=UPI0004872EF9|nr:SRPBCC family protein [Solimonas soli]
MISVACHIHIRRPPDAVFAFAGDYRNDPRWRRGVIDLQCEGEPRIGSRTREVIRFCGLRAETIAEVTAWDAGRRTAFEALSGPVPCAGRRLFEAEGEGTRFSYLLQLRPRGRWQWLTPLLGLLFRWQAAGDLRRLRRVLEAPLLQPA